MHRMHVTTVAIDGRAVCLSGPSGSGKSDLALRLIDGGATLVSDDYTDFETTSGRLMAHPPETLAGKLEARGYGIVTMPFLAGVPVALFVRLVPREAVERLPERDFSEIEGVDVPEIALHAFDVSAGAKIRMILRAEPVE